MPERVKVRTGDKGAAVFAARGFAPGETVLVFEGRDVVRARGRHTLQIGWEEHLVVDPPGRFVNHSCAPNCGLSGTRELVAMRALAPGEEIVFDYAMSEYESAMEGAPCLCASPRCRGRVGGWRDLPPERRAEYAPFLSAYLRSPRP